MGQGSILITSMSTLPHKALQNCAVCIIYGRMEMENSVKSIYTKPILPPLLILLLSLSTHSFISLSSLLGLIWWVQWIIFCKICIPLFGRIVIQRKSFRSLVLVPSLLLIDCNDRSCTSLLFGAICVIRIMLNVLHVSLCIAPLQLTSGNLFLRLLVGLFLPLCFYLLAF